MVICFLELRLELEEKKRELEEAKKNLHAEGSISAKSESNPILSILGRLHLKRDYCTLTQCFVTALDVLELLTNIGKLQENPTEDNSEKIRSKFKQIHSCTPVIIFISSFKKH